MYNSKLIEAIKLIPIKKTKKLVEFVNTPYFNKDKKVVDLVKYIIKFAPDYMHTKLSKTTCYSKIFPKEKFDDLKIRRLMSKSFKLVEEFIVVEEVDKSPMVKRQVLTKFYAKNQHTTFFYNQTDAWQKEIEAMNGYDLIQTYLENFVLSRERYLFSREQYGTVHSKQRISTFFSDWVNLVKNLENYLVSESLRLGATYISYITVFNNVGSNRFADTLLGKIVEVNLSRDTIGETYKDEKTILVYYYFYRLVANSSDNEAYIALKELMRSTEPTPDNISIISKAGNLIMGHLTRRILAGADSKQEQEEVFENYQFMLEKGVMFTHTGGETSISLWDFNNIVAAAIKVNQYDWAKNFIDEYQKYLPFMAQNSMVRYCYARLAFHKKDFKEVVQLLDFESMIEMPDTILAMRAKSIKLRAYYELEEIELLDSALNAFRVLIHRNDIFSKGQKVLSQNFINFMFRLINIKSGDQKKKQKLQKDIDICTQLLEKQWFLGKVEHC